MTRHHHPLPAHLRRSLLALCLCTGVAQPVLAQSLGVNVQGSSGGLAIPYAEVLSPGTIALSFGNYQDPIFGAPRDTEQNYSMGIGLLPYVEFFGRFAEYTNAPKVANFVSGTRDISANLKVRIPTLFPWQPKLAVGVHDISGGANNFKSAYAVATDQFGRVGVSLGYARGKSYGGRKPAFDGAFGGVNVRLTDNGLSALAELEGKQRHLGLRWLSPPIEWFSNARVVGNVYRTSTSLDAPGQASPRNHFGVSMILPLGENLEKTRQFQPAAVKSLGPIEPELQAHGGMRPTAQDRMASLRKALVDLGLERVRVGIHAASLIIEYENHRYAHNETDALGLIFGMGAELAPDGVKRIHAVTHKAGLRLYETSVSRLAYQQFLRGDDDASVRDTLQWDQLTQDLGDEVQWVDKAASGSAWVRLTVEPDLNYTLGTELGAFDYSLAGSLQLAVPVWKGGQLVSNVIVPMAHTDDMNPGAAYDAYRHRSGLKTLGLQHSFWLGNRVLSQVTVGRFYHDVQGVQAESMLFVPNTDDLIRVRGAAYNQAPGGLAGIKDKALGASYRRMLTPTMSLEAGAHYYGDGSKGPSLEWTRWFGDVSVQLFYRKGGNNQFAGLQMSLPLTPRQGMKPGSMFVTGASQYAQSVRTRLTTSSSPFNLVIPGAVRPATFDSSLDEQFLNAGRASRNYMIEDLSRMREAFYLFGRNALPS